MKIDAALAGVSRLFLDTAPVIYFVERNPSFVDRVDPIFERLESEITPVVGSVTVAECLVGALQMGLTNLEQAYVAIFTRDDVLFLENNLTIAREAARVRVRYNLQLPDAFQIATALNAGCQAFLTNDAQLKRIAELKILLVSELEA
ncbi:PIN domain-containing protein [Limnospira fusiformis KN01]|uniref:type II toxin-antitoxin system VapC family toxin n=1 Tax=Limnospira TaxID=2596745 RepID=UPI0016587EBA|nr:MULTISPECIES: PIN domain-containing protein [Limnospira]MDT9201253.1 PIN domain-containing protein [Limnospira sp. PMC 1042.18]ULB44016.1 PIN domain-containing protein [Limnospira fusiformis KN01]